MSAAQVSLGERLRSARETKGLSTQKAADAMHLDAWVIEALESGDYARIGPPVYAKGHLKRYAGLLGLPSAELVDAHDMGAAAAPAVAQASSLRMRASAPAERPIPWTPIAGVAAVALVMAGVYWWRPWHPRNTTPAAARIAAAAPIPAVEEAAASAAVGAEAAIADLGTRKAATSTGSVAPPAPTAAAAAGKPASTPATLPASDIDASAGIGHARLRLSFSADSWVDVHDAAGRRLYAGKGRANSVRTIAGDAPMEVYLGVASGVQLQVNSRVVAIGPQFVAGAVARFEAGADGVLRRDARAATANTPHPRG